MADNIVSSILRKTWPVVVTNPAAPNSGDPVRFGSMTGIAMLDEGDGGVGATKTVVDFGMYVADHPVTDVVAGIAVGDTVYYDDGADRLENDTTGTPYGIALETVDVVSLPPSRCSTARTPRWEQRRSILPRWCRVSFLPTPPDGHCLRPVSLTPPRRCPCLVPTA